MFVDRFCGAGGGGGVVARSLGRSGRVDLVARSCAAAQETLLHSAGAAVTASAPGIPFSRTGGGGAHLETLEKGPVWDLRARLRLGQR